MPPDGPDAGPEVVSSLVSYLVKPEAYFITGRLNRVLFADVLTFSSGQSITMDGGVVFS